MPLKALLAIAVTLGKLMPTMVLALALALVVPTKVMPNPLTVVAVIEVLALVTENAAPVPAEELLYVWDICPVPEFKVNV